MAIDNIQVVNKAKGANLADAIFHAANLIGEVRLGVSLTEALRKTPPLLRAACQSLSFNALRNRPVILSALENFIHRSVTSEIEDLLLVAASTLLPDSPNKYANHTLVNEAVKAAEKSEETIYAKGMINAVLRRVIENPNLLEFNTPALAHFPQWWLEKLKLAYPTSWREIILANQMHPPQFLRVNRQKNSREEYIAKLAQAGIECKDIPGKFQKLAPEAICIETPVPIDHLPGFSDGDVAIQDLGAQMAALLIEPKPHEKILDACAAPGGKAAHLLESAPIELLALEKDADRLLRIHENFDRLGLQAQVKCGDANELSEWWDGNQFDAILADVPCSASGIVRRHPDIPYLRRPEDLVNLKIAQRKILSNLWKTLKPGGRLLYVTCSVFPEEGENQIKWFLKNHTDAVRLPCLGQLLPSKWHDGFFYALLNKVA